MCKQTVSTNSEPNSFHLKLRSRCVELQQHQLAAYPLGYGVPLEACWPANAASRQKLNPCSPVEQYWARNCIDRLLTEYDEGIARDCSIHSRDAQQPTITGQRSIGGLHSSVIQSIDFTISHIISDGLLQNCGWHIFIVLLSLPYSVSFAYTWFSGCRERRKSGTIKLTMLSQHSVTVLASPQNRRRTRQKKVSSRG